MNRRILLKTFLGGLVSLGLEATTPPVSGHSMKMTHFFSTSPPMVLSDLSLSITEKLSMATAAFPPPKSSVSLFLIPVFN